MSEKRFAQLMDKVTDFAIFFADPDGIIEEWNVGAERLFGFSRSEAIGQLVEIIFVAEDRTAGRPTEEMRLAAEKGSAEDERWHVRRDGSFFFASGVMHALYEGDKLTGYVKLVRDLTHRAEMEAGDQDDPDSVDVTVSERLSNTGETSRVVKMEMLRKQKDDYLRLRLLQRAVESQEDERKRISREIHDELGQELTALRLRIEALKTAAAVDAHLRSAIDAIDEIAEKIDGTVDFLAWELRPNFVNEIGLARAIETYLKQWSSQFKIPAAARVRHFGGKRLNSYAEVNLYRILQESLNNVAKHARASKVDILLENRGSEVVMAVEDDGRGFDVEAKANKQAGLGLMGMGERAALLLGIAEIESTPGSGTSVYVRIPAQFAQPGETAHH
ncbi:MAG TPA: PAS domain-containing sensor histidine kinase [Pyrinomonadaceae bacterium]|nr:PAS domain-containing sensor histidine kinase [Pyrinomonadaceae bacterium]